MFLFKCTVVHSLFSILFPAIGVTIGFQTSGVSVSEGVGFVDLVVTREGESQLPVSIIISTLSTSTASEYSHRGRYTSTVVMTYCIQCLRYAFSYSLSHISLCTDVAKL